MRSADAEAVAAEALGCLAADPERLGRFLALTGLDPSTIRQAAAAPGFLHAVLAYLTADEGLLLAVASETGHGPETFAAAERALADGESGQTGGSDYRRQLGSSGSMSRRTRSPFKANSP